MVPAVRHISILGSLLVKARQTDPVNDISRHARTYKGMLDAVELCTLWTLP